jgi:hypothetical protein
MTQPIFRIFKKIKDIVWASYKRCTWNHLVIHRHNLTDNPPSLVLPLLCGPVKGKLRCPPDLTLLLVHNYDSLPIMELSLRYVGIKNYTVLNPQVGEPWRHSNKIVAILNYLNDGSCKTEYILFCDSNDAVLRDDPGKAIRYLEEENCDLLFSRTKFKGGYECIPHIKTWADQLAKQHDSSGWYINSGVYIVRTHFYRQVLEAAMTYITENDLPGKVYRKLRRDGGLGERLPEFPIGCGSDQAIFRYLHPQFYPQIKIDYQGRLALR